MPNERLNRVEERLAWLERHVTEQDKAMLEMGDEIARLRAELKLLHERAAGVNFGSADAAPLDERPPHY